MKYINIYKTTFCDIKLSILKFSDGETPSEFRSIEDRESLLSSLNPPENSGGPRYMETEEDVRSLPNDSVIDRLSHGIMFDTPRIGKAAPSEGVA